MESRSRLAEVSFLYPTLDKDAPCYDLEGDVVHHVSSSSFRSKAVSLPANPAAASTSILSLAPHGDCLGTTLQITGGPLAGALSVALTQPGGIVGAHTYLQATTLTHHLLACGMQKDADDADYIVLWLVYKNSQCLRVHLTAETLIPAKLVRITPHLPERSIAAALSDGQTEVSAVIFLDSRTVLLAASNLLVAVDLSQPSSHTVWSEARTRENSASFFESLSQNLFFGSQSDQILDMPHVAAILRVDNRVLTLHNDASLRQWTIHEGNDYPSEVEVFQVDCLPEEGAWSEEAIHMTAHFLDADTFLVGIYLCTKRNQGALVVFASETNETRRVETPLDAVDLVGMAWNFVETEYRLMTLWNGDSDLEQKCYMFPIGHGAPLEDVPRASSVLADVARKEKVRLAHLSFLPLIPDDLTTTAQKIRFIDRYHVQDIMRSAYPRGAGTVLAPEPHVIREAIRSRVPSLTDASIPVEVALVNVVHSLGDEEVDEMEMDGDELTVLERHEDRWRSLRLEIFRAEKSLRTPVYAGPSPFENDSLVVLREACCSVQYLKHDDRANALEDATAGVLESVHGGGALTEVFLTTDLALQRIIDTARCAYASESARNTINELVRAAAPILRPLSQQLRRVAAQTPALMDRLLENTTASTMDGREAHTAKHVRAGTTSLHGRLAAADVCARQAEIRTQTLLLNYMALNNEASLLMSGDDRLLSACLYAFGLRWAFAHAMDVHDVMSAVARPRGQASPSKRLAGPSFSVPGPSGKTNGLDSLVLTRPGDLALTGSLSSQALAYRREIVGAAFSSLSSIWSDDTNVPEMRLFPEDRGDAVLRLVSPFAPGNGQVRDHLLAEALLMKASKLYRCNLHEIADRMAETAFYLLDLPSSASPTSIKKLHELVIESKDLAFFFTRFVKDVVREVAPHLQECLFDAAVTAHSWDVAIGIAATGEQRDVSLKKVFRRMALSGSLGELLDLSNEQEYYCVAKAKAPDRGIDGLYTLARDALEQARDCQDTLYAFYACRGDWLQCARSQDASVFSVQTASSRTSPFDSSLPRSTADNLLSASQLSYNALLLMRDDDTCFVAGELTDQLLAVHDDDTRKRGHDLHFPPVTSQSSFSRLKRLRTVEDLRIRALQARITSTLSLEALVDAERAVVQQALMEQSSDFEMFPDLIDILFRQGRILEGLVLCGAFRSTIGGAMPGGVDVLHRFLLEAISDYLLPIIYSTGSDSILSVDDMEHLFESLTLGTRGSDVAPSVFVCPDGGEWMTETQITETCTAMVVNLVAHYSAAYPSLAGQAAGAFFDHGPYAMPVPSRLEEVVLRGFNPSPKQGVFSPFNARGETGFAGDPASLLSLYISKGLAVEAVRVVETVLSDIHRRDSLGKTPPERGGVQVVPYDKIDFLYDMLSVAIEDRTGSSSSDPGRLVTAKKSLESVMNSHFELLKLSEESLLASRRAA